MRQSAILLLLGILMLFGCDGQKRLNDANLRKPINDYLAANNAACIRVDGKFPIDISLSQWKLKAGQTSQMLALEHAGLVKSADTSAVVQDIGSALSFRPNGPQPVKRYQVTDEGRKYLHPIAQILGSSDGFCYGQEVVDSIVKWSEPLTQGNYTETRVTYTYKIDNLASWARSPEIQAAYPDMKLTTGQAGREVDTALHLTDQGWIVNGR